MNLMVSGSCRVYVSVWSLDCVCVVQNFSLGLTFYDNLTQSLSISTVRTAKGFQSKLLDCIIGYVFHNNIVSQVPVVYLPVLWISQQQTLGGSPTSALLVHGHQVTLIQLLLPPRQLFD